MIRNETSNAQMVELKLVFITCVLLSRILYRFRSNITTLCCAVVPDPTNSKSFKHANFQVRIRCAKFFAYNFINDGVCFEH